jgi:hypothetical protein
MKSLLFPLFILFISMLQACNLNSSQEQALNKQLGLYLVYYNTNNTLSLVAKTHPCLVEFAYNSGDEKFEEIFNPKEDVSYYTDFHLKKVSNKNEMMYVQIEVSEDYYYQSSAGKMELIAISKDDGKNWFFIPKKYFSKEYCKELDVSVF